MRKLKDIIKSLFGDKDFDCDITKVVGFGIVVCGIVGFFFEKSNFNTLLIFGSGLIATGKFSNQG